MIRRTVSGLSALVCVLLTQAGCSVDFGLAASNAVQSALDGLVAGLVADIAQAIIPAM